MSEESNQAADLQIDLVELCKKYGIVVMACAVMQSYEGGARIGAAIIQDMEFTEDQQDRLSEKLMYTFKKWLRDEKVYA